MNKPRSSIIFPQTLDLSVISIPPAVPETFNKRLHHHSSPFIVHINLWINLVEMISHSSSSRKGSSNTAFSIEQHTWSQWQHAEHWTDAPNRMALSSPLNKILQLDHLSDRGQIMWWLPPGQVKTLCYLRHQRAQERRPTNRRLCPQDRKFWDGTSTGCAHIRYRRFSTRSSSLWSSARPCQQPSPSLLMDGTRFTRGCRAMSRGWRCKSIRFHDVPKLFLKVMHAEWNTKFLLSDLNGSKT